MEMNLAAQTSPDVAILKPLKTQCVKIWDKYIYVNVYKKLWNKLKIFKALSVKYMFFMNY